MPDIVSKDNQNLEPQDPRQGYLQRINRPITERTILSRPLGRMIEQYYSVTDVQVTGPFDWSQAYDINKTGTHTTGRRGDFVGFLKTGIEAFATPVNETLSETPAVVCGRVDQGVFQESETIMRGYGDIFNPSSTGFVVVLGPEVVQTPGYQIVGSESRLKVPVVFNMAKAIVVGNDVMLSFVADELKQRGFVIPIIRLELEEREI